ncbi:MAG: hypothetical protein MZV64_13625 [Ignavibacteriales bacterium]|nr:hypothetical protein [Ignavibacteriales bacterium]
MARSCRPACRRRTCRRPTRAAAASNRRWSRRRSRRNVTAPGARADAASPVTATRRREPPCAPAAPAAFRVLGEGARDSRPSRTPPRAPGQTRREPVSASWLDLHSPNGALQLRCQSGPRRLLGNLRPAPAFVQSGCHRIVAPVPFS